MGVIDLFFFKRFSTSVVASISTREAAPDSGLVYIDQNAARNPSSPLEPFFRALYTQNPSFKIKVVDLVTDRNNVRKLLGFVKGSSSEASKIQVEIAYGKITLFTRIEDKPKEMIQDFRGFRHNFEDVYSKKQTPGITGLSAITLGA